MLETLSSVVARVVLLQELVHAMRVLERRVLFRDAVLVHLEGPGLLVVFSGLFVITREEAVQFSRSFEIRVHEERGIGVLDDIFLEDEVIVEDVLDHPAEEGDVRARTHGRVHIGLGSGLREAGIHDDQFRAFFLGFHDPFHGNGVVRCGIAPHNEDNIGIANIDPVIRHCTAPERLSQSRYSCGVSDSSLVFYIYQAPGPHQFLEHVALFVVQGRAPHMGDAVGPVHDEVLFNIFFRAVGRFFFYLGFRGDLEGPVAGVLHPFGDLVERPVPLHFLALRCARRAILGFRETEWDC